VEKKVLLVDDEQGLIDMVRTLLKREGFEQVFMATTGTEALRMIQHYEIDLIVLDVMLPDYNGFDLCREIRNRTKAPIIFLTARTSDLDKITGLTLGGDDYVTKPFNPMELLARIMAHLRRSSYTDSDDKSSNEKEIMYDYGRFILHVTEGSLTVDGRKIKCPLKEFELLQFLCEHPNQVFSLQHLYERVWGHESCGDERTVMVHIRRLRQKIEIDPNQPRYIVNLRGFGYKLVRADEETDENS